MEKNPSIYAMKSEDISTKKRKQLYVISLVEHSTIYSIELIKPFFWYFACALRDVITEKYTLEYCLSGHISNFFAFTTLTTTKCRSNQHLCKFSYTYNHPIRPSPANLQFAISFHFEKWCFDYIISYVFTELIPITFSVCIICGRAFKHPPLLLRYPQNIASSCLYITDFPYFFLSSLIIFVFPFSRSMCDWRSW